MTGMHGRGKGRGGAGRWGGWPCGPGRGDVSRVKPTRGGSSSGTSGVARQAMRGWLHAAARAHVGQQLHGRGGRRGWARAGPFTVAKARPGLLLGSLSGPRFSSLYRLISSSKRRIQYNSALLLISPARSLRSAYLACCWRFPGRDSRCRPFLPSEQQRVHASSFERHHVVRRQDRHGGGTGPGAWRGGGR